ncbi:hypothetical protein [Polaribacter sp. MED152]|uniref:hypothetical protein n=1 Tax=Polaribacter sp. MED152 TaxID=313598 RepID=UPI000068C7E5|nr:hypothetical protein [Polaribacter sp. MED152]EAQ41946.1 hypothetical protein MED152_04490 [Polaribacter sp. MED152]
MIKSYWNKGSKQKRNVILLLVVILGLLFFLRDDYQPALLFFRKFIFIIILCGTVLFLGIRKFRKTASTGSRLGILGLMIVFFGALYYVGISLGMYNYIKTYNVFNDLNRIEIVELPLTQNERIQPLRNIFSMANESVGETKDVSLPHLVRVDDSNQWTMAIQPTEKYYWQGIKDNTEEIFSVSSTTPFPRFSSENRIPVTFSIGESLRFSRNTYNAVVQRFNPWMLFNYEPSDTFYMKNDKGAWVQVVSLIKWKGFFFPYPTFGGVMIVENGEHNFTDYLERITIGKGTFIAPEKMKDYQFLTKQNTLSEKVSRLQAESLKFLAGFSDPLPWNMKSAVKIPVAPKDQNQQPYVTDFDFSGTNVGAYSGLYHWFGLEPIGAERTSLSYSVFIPADGSNQFYFYDHASKKQGYAGVSAMPLKVKESKKEYDWNSNAPVEFRPYIKNIAGKKRMFFLGTVSTISSDNPEQFDGAATPDLALVDSEYRDVVWINAKKPSTWNEELYMQLNEAWRTSENENLYFEKEKTILEKNRQILDSIQLLSKQQKKLEEIERLQKQIDSIKMN